VAGKIAEFVDTRYLAVLDAAKARLPAGIVGLTNVPGIGPKKARALYDKLKVHSVADLKKLHGLAGFGVKSETKLIAELKRRRKVQRRFRLDTAEDFAAPLLEHLMRSKGVLHATIAGSYRRRKDTVGDLDILVAAHSGSEVMQRFVSYDEVDDVAAQGETRATVVLRSGLQVDLRVEPLESYGAALHYFMGSKSHNSASSASTAVSRSMSTASFEAQNA
jgi:DNA polymerase (family X)